MTNYEVKNYDEIRDSLRVRLMDMKSNADKLQDLIYEPMSCGYALVAYMELPGSLVAIVCSGVNHRKQDSVDPKLRIDGSSYSGDRPEQEI